MLLLPTLIVGALVALAVHTQLNMYGDANGLVHFGSFFANRIDPPRGAITGGLYGYDGQWYWVLAHDPLLLHNSTFVHLHFQKFRAQRIAYPALSYLAAKILGVPTATGMLLVNVALVIGGTLAFSIYARRRGWSPWWALGVGLLPGLLLGTLYDLTDPLATVAVLTGLILWSRGSRRLAPFALVVAVLAREVMVLLVLGVALEALNRAWSRRHEHGAWLEVARDSWPGVVIPGAAFAAWHFYIEARTGGNTGTAAATPFFASYTQGFRKALHLHGTLQVWAVAFELLMFAAIAVALISLWWDRSAVALTAALIALSLGIADYGPVIGDTRDSAPLFALLLAAGLQRRNWWVLAPTVGAAALTLTMPFLVPGVFPHGLLI